MKIYHDDMGNAYTIDRRIKLRELADGDYLFSVDGAYYHLHRDCCRHAGLYNYVELDGDGLYIEYMQNDGTRDSYERPFYLATDEYCETWYIMRSYV